MTPGADMTVSGWALTYSSKGLSPTPVAFKGKIPILPEWQKLRLTQAELAFHSNGIPRNLGILLGEPSNGVVDIDLDVPEAVRLASYILDPTGWRFGRSGSLDHTGCMKPAHWSRQPDRRTRWDDAGRAPEYRSTGSQTVVPYSAHQSGEPIQWVEFNRPAMTDGKALKRNVSRLAAAALLARNWPKPGTHPDHLFP